jgi:hypothetical protein
LQDNYTEQYDGDEEAEAGGDHEYGNNDDAPTSDGNGTKEVYREVRMKEEKQAIKIKV